MKPRFIWLDGDLVDWDSANVHVASHGLHYGIGFFEGVRCYSTGTGPVCFRLKDHIRRLISSAATYRLALPYGPPEISAAVKETIKANQFDEGYVRPIAFLGEGETPFKSSLRLAIIVSKGGPISSPDAAAVRAKISTFQRIPVNSLPVTAKATGQYLNAYLAQSEAAAGGYDEALCLNQSGYVVDGWAHNIFIVKGDSLITPPVASGALAGITRESILTLARESGMSTIERDIIRTEVYQADECFLTGTANGVTSIWSVDDRSIRSGAPGPITVMLRRQLFDIILGGASKHSDWCEPVYGS